MKAIILSLALFIGLAFAAAAQENTSETLTDLNVVPAQFMGADYNHNAVSNADELKAFLWKHIKYPNKAQKFMRQGVEVVQFSVSAEGNVEDIKIVNSVHYTVDEELIRALKLTDGMWKPAVKDGSKHACAKEVSLTFSLSEDPGKIEEDFLELATDNYLKGSELLVIDHKFKKAERFMSTAMRYLPNDPTLLYLRGICRYQNGNTAGAMEDWNRYTTISGYETPDTIYAEELKAFEAYEAFLSMNKTE